MGRALPNPNGYDDFLKAGAAIVGDAGTAPDLDETALSVFVSTNSESLRLIRLGLTRACSVPTDAAITNFGAHMPHLMTIKHLAQLLAAEGRLAEMQGRSVEAAKNYMDAIQLGNNSSFGGLLIDRLVGIAAERLGYAGLLKVVSKLDDTQLEPLIERLQKIDEGRIGWNEVNEVENRFARAEARNIPNPWVLVASWWQSRAAKKKAREKHEQMVTRLRLLTVELELRRYRAQHGAAPQRLDQVVPGPVPLDPFTEQSLIYRSIGTNWLLYSVGPDNLDNGGKSVGRSAMGARTKGDVLFDSPF